MEKIIDSGTSKDSKLMKKMIIIAIIVMVLFVLCGIIEYVLKNLYIKKTVLKYKNTIVDKLLNIQNDINYSTRCIYF